MVANPPPAPEVDDELAAMEAANAESATSGKSAARVLTERLLATVLNRRTAKGTPTQGPKGGEKGVRDQRRSMSPDRAMARAATQASRTADRTRTPHARLGRAKAKKSPAQLNWEFREAARKALCKIKLTMIQVHCPEIKFVIGHPGLRTVWQLSQLDTATVHAIPGFGPKRRAAVAKYLREHQVPCKWVP